MNHTKKSEIFTIGYSCYKTQSIIEVLKKYSITAIADVRSVPFSNYKPEFNRDKLESVLRKENISYVFLGDNCGARIKAPECYVNGKVDYTLVANHPRFKEGLKRLKKGMQNYRIALMCAEKDPITCHRAILICRNLQVLNLHVRHILCNGNIEEHYDSEKRLMKLFKLDQPGLFKTESQRIEEAYRRQSKKIAFINNEEL